MGWSVAVTGSTGDIGISAVDALDQSPEVELAAETLAALAKAV